jgi:hypothetical protein
MKFCTDFKPEGDQMELCTAVMVIVDISGYTKFMTLRTISLLHAEQIITDLINEVIDRAEHPLILNKLEGDAAFLYAPVPSGFDPAVVAGDVMRQALKFFLPFKEKVRQLATATVGCPCDACVHLSELRLKTVIHIDEIAVKRVRQFEEL